MPQSPKEVSEVTSKELHTTKQQSLDTSKAGIANPPQDTLQTSQAQNNAMISEFVKANVSSIFHSLDVEKYEKKQISKEARQEIINSKEERDKVYREKGKLSSLTGEHTIKQTIEKYKEEGEMSKFIALRSDSVQGTKIDSDPSTMDADILEQSHEINQVEELNQLTVNSPEQQRKNDQWDKYIREKDNGTDQIMTNIAHHAGQTKHLYRPAKELNPAKAIEAERIQKLAFNIDSTLATRDFVDKHEDASTPACFKNNSLAFSLKKHSLELRKEALDELVNKTELSYYTSHLEKAIDKLREKVQPSNQ